MHQIRNFIYNGFTGKLTEGFAPYTGTFIKWTEDPGIILMACSDKKERLIPSFALMNMEDIPNPPRFPEGSKYNYWGIPSRS